MIYYWRFCTKYKWKIWRYFKFQEKPIDFISYCSVVYNKYIEGIRKRDRRVRTVFQNF